MTAIVVMAKAPVPGRSKTRLCPPCTPVEAAALAEAALGDTLEAVSRSSAGRRVLALEGAPGPWLAPGFEVVPQRGGGLDERIGAAVRDVGEACLVVGMDTPQVSAADLDDALARLWRPGTDAVLGMAEDGGWWAAGLRVPGRAAFDGVPMSDPATGVLQWRRFRSMGLRIAALPVSRDVDTFEDALAVAGLAPASRFAARLHRLRAEPRPDALAARGSA